MAWQWTFQSTVNQVTAGNSTVNIWPSTGSWAMYYLYEALKGAGWTVIGTGDGTNYAANGTKCTTGASGLLGLGNNYAWFCLQTPTLGRQLCVQRMTTDTSWRIKWSHTAGFVGGTPSGTQTPLATDEYGGASNTAGAFAGGGTDAAPTGYGLFNTNNTYRIYIGCNLVAPYDFYMIIGDQSVFTNRHLWYIGMESGSYPTEDTAPYIVNASISALTAATGWSLTANQGYGQGYYKYGLAGQYWTTWRAVGPNSNVQNYVPLKSLSSAGRQELAAIHMMRFTGESSPANKGWIPLSTLGFSMVQRQRGDWFTAGGGTVAYAYFDDIAIRWPVGVIPGI
jgi:hypothetical protein